MLGLRGVRLGLVVPGLFDLQVRAIAEATAQLIRMGRDPQPEIMIPLVGSVQELEIIETDAKRVLAEIAERTGVQLAPLGTMIELPRAALTAGQIAEAAEFFSFGTNDLTQTTWGFSRDDVEAAFFSTYLEMGIFGVSPFETLDVDGVGELVRIGTARGRAPARTSRSASAASTVVTPTRSTSSTVPGWITSPARRSGSPSPAWRPPASCSAGLVRARRDDNASGPPDPGGRAAERKERVGRHDPALGAPPRVRDPERHPGLVLRRRSLLRPRPCRRPRRRPRTAGRRPDRHRRRVDAARRAATHRRRGAGPGGPGRRTSGPCHRGAPVRGHVPAGGDARSGTRRRQHDQRRPGAAAYRVPSTPRPNSAYRCA